ncbi:MAG: TIGR03905 family TSCPD domain-containing protein [Clostridiales bacterium]|nr:TIGR03905 family TSCPD domain-containing protein [Clostridiales bacterium]
MKYNYTTCGTCSRQINFEIDDNGRLHNVSFIGGCNGNLKGISLLVDGMTPTMVIDKLKGVTCGNKSTSCPDQLARAMEAINAGETIQ